MQTLIQSQASGKGLPDAGYTRKFLSAARIYTAEWAMKRKFVPGYEYG